MTKVALLKSRINYVGGLEKNTAFLAQAFQKAGCSVTLLTTGEKANYHQDIACISLAKTTKFSLKHYLHFDFLCKNWLKKNPQDIIFGLERTTCHTHYRAGGGVHAAFLQRRSLTESFWKKKSFLINPLHRALLMLEKKGFEHPDLKMIFTNSSMVAQEITQYYGTPNEKIRVVHNGVDWQGCNIEQKSAASPFHFLFIGNDYNRKGLAFLLRGLSQLSVSDWILTVIGKEKNVAIFQKIACNLGLEKKVHFRGPQIDLAPFFREADVLVIPSIYDPFSNVTLEALARGLFVVSSKFNGGHEVLTKKTGVIINELFDTDSVKEALEISLKNPKTCMSSDYIRNSVKELEITRQIDTIIKETLTT